MEIAGRGKWVRGRVDELDTFGKEANGQMEKVLAQF